MKKKVALSQSLPTAMAFFHEDGFVPAWSQASRFAGNNGRIATLPDIIEARINTDVDNTAPWGMYFTTLSAEYFGYSKGGKRILIVAHGVGPMSTMDGVVEAYSFQFKDRTRHRRGGRITKEQFADLESGKYGEVSIIDFDSYYRSYHYAFMEQLCVSVAKCDPLVRARLGKRFDEYLDCHGKFAGKWHRQENHRFVVDPYDDPYIMTMADDSNCWYAHRKDQNNPRSPIEVPFLDKDGLPLAHLLSIGGISYLHGNTEYPFPSFHSEVSCHAWYDGTRLVGIRDNEPVQSIHWGIDPRGVLKNNWRELMIPVKSGEQPSNFHTLMKFGGGYFTMYPKVGEQMDSHEPEFMVVKNKTMSGGATSFRAKGYGSPLFRYGVKEIFSLAPRGANAYSLGQPVPDGDDHVCPVKFHRVEVDTTKRLMRANDLLRDYELLMSFL